MRTKVSISNLCGPLLFRLRVDRLSVALRERVRSAPDVSDAWVRTLAGAKLEIRRAELCGAVHHFEMTPELDPMTRHFPVWDVCDVAVVVAAIRTELADNSQRQDGPSLDEFLGAMEAWLRAYPLTYEDTGACAEEIGARFFADALLAAASGGTFTSRWYSSVGFDET